MIRMLVLLLPEERHGLDDRPWRLHGQSTSLRSQADDIVRARLSPLAAEAGASAGLPSGIPPGAKAAPAPGAGRCAPGKIP
jgi:hypothetical protein